MCLEELSWSRFPCNKAAFSVNFDCVHACWNVYWKPTAVQFRHLAAYCNVKPNAKFDWLALIDMTYNHVFSSIGKYVDEYYYIVLSLVNCVYFYGWETYDNWVCIITCTCTVNAVHACSHAACTICDLNFIDWIIWYTQLSIILLWYVILL